MSDVFNATVADGTLTITVTAAWDVTRINVLSNALKTLQSHDFSRVALKPGHHIPVPDSNSVYLLYRYIIEDRITIDHVDLSAFNTQEQQLIRRILDISASLQTEPPTTPRHNRLYSAIAAIGKAVCTGNAQVCDIIAFFGKTCSVFGKAMLSPRRFHFASIIRHADETGIGAAPIVALLAFLISVVLSYQAATQLKPYGAEIFTVDLTAISILREMGVMLTAIIVAGRSGSAFAAEIGVMRLREETDALETLGIDPYETLVLPRVLALMFTLPLLTFLANIVGLTGGGLLSLAILDISVTQYINRIADAVTVSTFLIGMVKAPIFAVLIAITGTWQGMRTSGSAESVGRMTTVSVVRAIFLVLLADALFSILFSHLGI